MNFRPRKSDEPEINLIPFIDVLLVVLIFVMLSTTYSKFTEMQLKLPTANGEAQKDYPKELIVTISSEGNYSIDHNPIPARDVESLTGLLRAAAKETKDPVIIISADANAKHQAIITLMEASRRAGLFHITFATQATSE